MRTLLAIIALVCAGLSSALAQPLACPPVAAAAGRPCEMFHYHVQLFRPDTRGFVELYGINQFASQSACDRARDAQFKRNMAVVEFFHTQRRDWWQADKFGSCHCDMTVEKTSPNWLSDTARWSQIQMAEDIRQRVRERLLDAGSLSDAELIRGLLPTPAATPLIGGSKLVTMPAAVAPSSLLNAPDDLRITKAADTTATSTSSLDLPLAEIPLAGIAAPQPVSVAAAPLPAPAQAPVADTPQPAPVPQPAPPPQPAPAPVSAVPQAPPPPTPPIMPPALEPVAVVAADESDLPAPEDVADAFISYESQRIQNVLKVSGSIGDEAVKAQVLDACTQRIQLLSNLRSIIVGSGARSRLVAAANGAKKESERLAVVSKLFGSDIPPHWAPKDAADVIFDPGITDPERVLRDATSSDQEKRHALYVLLATSSPTEQQQMWLTSVIEALLK
ncbi:MAG: hypothetical protein QOC81_2507 [Thermoanaerobaculia bacterium]|jgi:hypothetical protein|nr:hypothetical protein [Thermoanaerobaculia bacterium]